MRRPRPVIILAKCGNGYVHECPLNDRVYTMCGSILTRCGHVEMPVTIYKGSVEDITCPTCVTVRQV